MMIPTTQPQILLPTFAAPTHHPATYTASLLPIFTKHLLGCANVLDPLAGTGKIGNIKLHGYRGYIVANDIEEWGTNRYVDEFHHMDAAHLTFADGAFASVCCSPPYGNRIANSALGWNRKFRYNTYDRALGRPLQRGNAGSMVWGDAYRETHTAIWRECIRVLKPHGIFILNISDHIRSARRVYVSKWHLDTLRAFGLTLEKTYAVRTPRLRLGANADARCACEYVFVMRKAK